MDDVIAPEKALPRRRRWYKILLGVALLIIGLIAAFPWFASSERVCVWLLAKANVAMSPSRLEIEKFRFSWFAPTVIDGLAIYDPEGGKVVEAKQVVWGRNLYGILFRRPDFGLFTLKGMTLDLERRDDGSINLVEALKPILKGTPETDFRIEARSPGLIRLRSQELAKPLEFPTFDLNVRRPAAPGKVEWNIEIKDREIGEMLTYGSFDRWDGKPVGENDLNCFVSMDALALPLVIGNVSALSRGNGTMKVMRHDGLWNVGGDWKDIAAELSGVSLHGDTPTIKVSQMSWEIQRTANSWVVQALDVRSPLANFQASRIPPNSVPGAKQIAASVNLVEISKIFPKTLGLRDGLRVDGGIVGISLRTQPEKDATFWEVKADVSDLAGQVHERVISWKHPLTATIKGRASEGLISVDSGGISSDFLNAEGNGDLEKGVKLAGTLDLATLTRTLSDYVDLGGLALDGQGSFGGTVRRSNDKTSVEASATFDVAKIGPKDDPLTVAGLRASLTAESPNSLSDWRWSGSVDLQSVGRAGLTLENTRVSIREDQNGLVAIDSIDGTLNGGKLHLLPELTFGNAPMLRLKTGSTLENALVNEEASRRVLSFVAPILDGASVNKGFISARIDRAEFPLSSEAKTKSQVEGQIVFQDLEFTPGPIAADLLSLIGRNDPTIRLDQPVVLSIADGRIRQTGLALPVGKVARITIEGDVGFDRSLDLTATIPITSEMFPNSGFVGDILAGTRITVPITGTLSRPRIDREAFREEMARMGKNIGMRAATRSAAELLFRLSRPRDPNAPAPLTPAERKARRQERKLEKRG